MSSLEKRRKIDAAALWGAVGTPAAAVVVALIIGAAVLFASGADPVRAYAALFKGAFGSVSALGRTLEKSTPLIFSGLAVALAFKAGLFNIGTQGQLLLGALVSGVAGFHFAGLPGFIHAPAALAAGAIAGGLVGWLMGALKAHTGAHEVITGIMLNYVAINATDFLASGPFRDPAPGNIIARTPLVADTAALPAMAGIPPGFFLAILAALAVWWVLQRTTPGFEIRTVGGNPDAAQYAGMPVAGIVVWTMVLSGFLAGMGGGVETLGIVGRFQPGFNVGLGFEGITIALLGRVHPLGVVLASVLVGAMKAGANLMQFDVGVGRDIIDVILALMLFFVAADVLIRKVIPGAAQTGELFRLSKGWSKP